MAIGSISSLGVGSNLDLQKIIEQLRQAEEKASISPLEKRKTDVEVRLAEFDALQAKFLTMKSHALNLSLSSNFRVRNTTVTNEAVLDATAVTGASLTNDTVEVVRLATRSSFQAAGVADANAAIITSDTVFEYQMGSGNTISLAVTAGTTLNQLVTTINKDTNNPGITAAVINDGTAGTPYRLVLTANATGEDNRITVVTQLADLPLSEVQGNGTSLNAEIRVNGVTYERQRNRGLTDVLQGVSLQLKGVGSTALQISADTSAIKSEITGLVEAFHEVVQEIKANSGYHMGTGGVGSLAASASIRALVGELTALVGRQTNTGGSVTSLYDLGLQVNRDGSITLDESVLASTLSSASGDIEKLFAGDEHNNLIGLGQLLNDRLRDITKSSGVMATEKGASQTAMERLETRIAEAKAYLDKRFDTLTRQFAALDVFMSQIQSQANIVSNLINAFNTNKK